MARPRSERVYSTRVRKTGSVVPFGYVLDEHDPKLLQPVPLQLDMIEWANANWGLYTPRSIAAHVTKVCGRSISHVGLAKAIKRWKKENERTRAIAKAAQQKAANLQAQG